ncbi:MAG TPA: glucose-6-phosphate isomerase, partial [Dyella sp.]
MSPDRRSSFLAEHVDRLARTHLRELLKDTARGKRLRQRAGPILLDLSRQKLDEAALEALGAHVEASAWQAARDAMFAGALINTSEQRAVLHTALRASGSQLASPA